jgi:hypothetical protein
LGAPLQQVGKHRGKFGHSEWLVQQSSIVPRFAGSFSCSHASGSQRVPNEVCRQGLRTRAAEQAEHRRRANHLNQSNRRQEKGNLHQHALFALDAWPSTDARQRQRLSRSTQGEKEVVGPRAHPALIKSHRLKDRTPSPQIVRDDWSLYQLTIALKRESPLYEDVHSLSMFFGLTQMLERRDRIPHAIIGHRLA